MEMAGEGQTRWWFAPQSAPANQKHQHPPNWSEEWKASGDDDLPF
jgi:hypothetical protein